MGVGLALSATRGHVAGTACITHGGRTYCEVLTQVDPAVMAARDEKVRTFGFVMIALAIVCFTIYGALKLNDKRTRLR